MWIKCRQNQKPGRERARLGRWIVNAQHISRFRILPVNNTSLEVEFIGENQWYSIYYPDRFIGNGERITKQVAQCQKALRYIEYCLEQENTITPDVGHVVMIPPAEDEEGDSTMFFAGEGVFCDLTGDLTIPSDTEKE